MIFTIHLQEGQPLNNPSKGPGTSLCSITHIDDLNCTLNHLSADILPEGCTAFIFVFIASNLNFDVYEPTTDENKETLVKLCQKGKNVYVNYGYSPGEWQILLACMACNPTNALEQSKNINAFLKDYPGVTGLILRNLEPWFRTRETVGYTENIIKFIEIIKQETGLEIGLTFMADFFQYNYEENSNIPWLDFSILNKYVDFYIMELFSYFNQCTYRLRKGVLPITGNEDSTLTKIESFIQNAGIPKEKMYYNVILSPKSPDSRDLCELNYQEMCISPENSKNWCADTQETYFKKGQWIKQNGAGFIGSYINFDDPLGCCNCGPNPSFNAILAGLNGSASIPPCPLYDRC